MPHMLGERVRHHGVLSHSHFDLVEDELELEPRAQEYFDSFDCHGTCAGCGKDSSLANFELA
jgi:hypothetical protein